MARQVVITESEPETRKLERDRLAALAMQGLVASQTKGTPAEFARGAYAIADAMLAERDRKPA